MSSVYGLLPLVSSSASWKSPVSVLEAREPISVARWRRRAKAPIRITRPSQRCLRPSVAPRNRDPRVPIQKPRPGLHQEPRAPFSTYEPLSSGRALSLIKSTARCLPEYITRYLIAEVKRNSNTVSLSTEKGGSPLRTLTRTAGILPIYLPGY